MFLSCLTFSIVQNAVSCWYPKYVLMVIDRCTDKPPIDRWAHTGELEIQIGLLLKHLYFVLTVLLSGGNATLPCSLARHGTEPTLDARWNEIFRCHWNKKLSTLINQSYRTRGQRIPPTYTVSQKNHHSRIKSLGYFNNWWFSWVKTFVWWSIVTLENYAIMETVK